MLQIEMEIERRDENIGNASDRDRDGDREKRRKYRKCYR